MDQTSLSASFNEAALGLHEMLATMPGGLFQTILHSNGEMAMAYASDGYFELYGMSRETLTADPSLILKLIHPDDIVIIAGAMRQSFETFAPANIEYRMTRDGQERWIACRWMPKAMPNGAVMACGCLFDITEQKLAEQSLAAARVATEAARAASAAKSLFLANMSHELRTPLNAIIGYAELVFEELEEQAPQGPMQKDLGKITGAAKHLLSLVNDVLDLAKIEAGSVDKEIDAFDPVDLAHEVAAMCAPLAEDAHAVLRWRGGEDLGYVRSDAAKVKQCLLNLLSGACRCEQGGGDIEISAERVFVDLRSMIRFSVFRAGVALSPDEIAGLFDAFQQTHSSTVRRNGDTGLSLAITRETARLLGGDVWFESTPGVGATAYLTIADEAARVIGLEVDALVGEAAAPRVLVVEDVAEARELIARALTPIGFSVQGVASARAGLKHAREDRPAVIVLDIFLPDALGWSLLSDLKQDPLTADIPVIVYSTSEDRKQSMALGAAEHILKPARRDQLAANVLRFARERPEAPAHIEPARMMG